MELLAKSKSKGGQTLLEHSTLVSEVAVAIAKQSLDGREDLIKEVRICAMLHDIGKATTGFQNLLATNGEVSSGYKYQHNQVGWAFLVRYAKLESRILSTIYWHHGLYNDDEVNSNLILTELSGEDMKGMLLYLHSVKDELGIEINSDEDDDAISPRYYLGNTKEDMIQAFTRYCVISADKLVSEHNINDVSEIDVIIKGIVEKKVFEITKAPYGDNERWRTQNEIVSKAGKTTMVKAPAGFGKTMIGLLFSIKSNKKLLWVCPRNVVADSVYHSLLKEIKTMGLDLSIEMYLTGEVKKSNKPTKGFESDITITNIDNYLAPSLDNNDAQKLYMINSCDVVFDEYHELVDDSALFGCFLNIMRVRNRLTNSKTLLLSATPIPMHFQWELRDKYKTTILPEDGVSHYKAAHDKPYRINIISEDVRSIEGFSAQERFEPGTLLIANSVRNVQKSFSNGFQNIFHSYYEPEDRQRILENLYRLYGKESNRLEEKESTVSSHVIQASMDISFRHLFESVISPESTLQRIGRCNRWGDYEGECTINLFNSTDRGERMIKDVIYDSNLTSVWFNYLANRLHNKQYITLDELYVLYNNFIVENMVSLKRYIERRAGESMGNMASIYARRRQEREKTDIRIAGSNRLRTSAQEIFYTTQKVDVTGDLIGEWSDIFSHKIRVQGEIKREFKEGFQLEFILRAMETMQDERYDFSEILSPSSRRYITRESLVRRARISFTPYLRFDRVYHPILGVVDTNII